MKNTFRILAITMVVTAAVTWLATGANRGWTKTSVATKTTDVVTGIDGFTYEKRFVAGLDFLGAAWLGASLLAGVSFLFQNKHINNHAN